MRNRSLSAVRQSLVVVAFLFFVAACGNLTTTPLDLTQTPAGAEIKGMPFTLNRVTFTIVHTPGAAGTPDTYLMMPAYEADSHRRFQLQLDPASPFATVDWTVSYDSSGSFASTTAKVTDQTVQVIASVGKLAAGLVTMAGSGPGRGASIANLEPTALPHIQCTDLSDADSKTVASAAPDPLGEDLKVESLPPLDQTIWINIQLRLINKSTPFFYRSEKELEVLKEALSLATKQFPSSTCATTKYVAVNPGSNTPAFSLAKKIDAAVKASDAAKLRKILVDAKPTVAADLAKLTLRLSAEVDPDYRIDPGVRIPSELADAFTQINLEKSFIAEASEYKYVYSGSTASDWNKATEPDGMHPLIGLLLDAIAADKNTIEARQLAALDKCIADLQAQERFRTLNLDAPNAVGPPQGDVDPADMCQAENVSSGILTAEKASLLRLNHLFAARTNLEASVANASGKDMKAATDEIAVIDMQIASAQAAVTSASIAAKPDDPVQARVIVYPANVPTPSAVLVTELQKDSVIATTHPQYVIVLQPPAYQPLQSGDSQ